MPGAITTCAKCGAEYSWNTDYQECPDCPGCGYNGVLSASLPITMMSDMVKSSRESVCQDSIQQAGVAKFSL